MQAQFQNSNGAPPTGNSFPSLPVPPQQLNGIFPSSTVGLCQYEAWGGAPQQQQQGTVYTQHAPECGGGGPAVDTAYGVGSVYYGAATPSWGVPQAAMAPSLPLSAYTAAAGSNGFDRYHYYEGEDARVEEVAEDTPACDVSGGYSSVSAGVSQKLQEEEQEEGEGGGRTQKGARLYIHPAVVEEIQVSNGMNPIMAALHYRQERARLGYPTSPLSPRTLQLLAATFDDVKTPGIRDMSWLTPADIVAPPPLALTWYPEVEPDVTVHAERKRGSADTNIYLSSVGGGGSAAAAMGQRMSPGSECDMMCSRRRRLESSLPSSFLQNSSALGVAQFSLQTATGGREEGDEEVARPDGGENGERKRQREEERVFEFQSRGRRFY